MISRGFIRTFTRRLAVVGYVSSDWVALPTLVFNRRRDQLPMHILSLQWLKWGFGIGRLAMPKIPRPQPATNPPVTPFSAFSFSAYVGNDGSEVKACLIHEDTPLSNDTAKKGEWLVRDTDGHVRIYHPDAFARDFRQKYPRPVDGPTPARSETTPKTAI